MIISKQIIKDVDQFFPEILMIKDPAIWLDKRHNWPQSLKSDNLRCYHPLMTSSMKKKKISSDSFCRILIIKESCNLVGQETQLAPPNLWISIFIKFKLTLNWYALPNIWLQCKDKLILIQSWKNTSYKGSIKKVLVLLTLKKFWNDML